MFGVSVARNAVSAVALALIVRHVAAAASAPPDPSPTPTATPRGVQLQSTLNLLALTQAASGAGLRPVEGPTFAQGAPAAPVTPYDVFSGAPLVPGNVQQNQFLLDALWGARGVSVGIDLGVESLFGDRTDQAYWAEPLQPQDDVHLGTAANTYAIVFPTHPGTDDYNAVRGGVEQVRVSADGDALMLRGGWFAMTQTLPSVFTPPVGTGVVPGLLLKTPESLNPSTPDLDDWTSAASTLSLRGFDASYTANHMTVEAADALLPSLPGTLARLESGSASRFDDRGRGVIVQWIHAFTGGDPISTSAGFGADFAIVPSDQGPFTVSMLHGQRETIAGAKGVTSIGSSLLATLEYAHSRYASDGLGKPQAVGGSFAHVALSRAIGPTTAAIHYYRFEPTFATMILPYGVPENIWSVAYSWPGPWLKSNFQLVDSSTLGVNRQGPLYSLTFAAQHLQASASYSAFRQIAPLTAQDAPNLGFVEGFFLVQRDAAAATLGTFRRFNAYVGVPSRIGTFGLDFVDDGLHRDGRASEPIDTVTYDAPQYVASLTRQAGSRVVASLGEGYFGTRGTWEDDASTNVDFGMHVAFAGAQFDERPGDAVMLTLRRSTLRGRPYFGALGALRYGSPDLDATTVVLEQRVRL